MYTQLRPYLHTHPTHHDNEFAPLASPVESRVKGSSSAHTARPANSVHSISLIQPPGRVLQYFSPGRMRRHLKVHEHQHASQAAASPTRLSRHLNALMPLRHGHKSPESADRTYHHRKCRTCAVRSTSGAQRAETERPYALHSLLRYHHRRKTKSGIHL